MTDQTVTRRAAVVALAGGAAATAATQSKAATQPLDLNDPAGNLEGYIKARADTAGGEVIFWSRGMIHSHIPNRKPRALFGTEALTISRVERTDYGFAWYNREALFYTDAETGEVINEWYNPFIERTVPVFHLRNPYVNSPYRVQGENGPWHYNFYAIGDDVMFYRDLMFFGPNPMDREEYPAYVGSDFYQGAGLYNFACKKSDLDNPDLTSAPCISVWNSVRQWFPWMEMGQWEGGMVAATRGSKLMNGKADIRPQFREYLEKNDPDYLRAPQQDVNARTTMLEEFKIHVDDKRQGGGS